MFSPHALATLPWAVVLSAIALFLAWRAYRKADYALTVRRVGWAVLAWAVWLVGLMRLAVRIGGAIADWAAGFVFRPSVWLGLAVGVLGVLLVAGGTFMRRRRGDGSGTRTEGRQQVEPSRGAASKATADDDDMSDIEDILRKHGIE